MRALLAQLASTPGDLDGNARRAADALAAHPNVDIAVFPELFLGQVNYPNDELSVSNRESAALAREWTSAFFQSNPCPDPGLATTTCHSFRITSINASPSVPGGPPSISPGLPGPLPAPVPLPTPPDLLCVLVGGHC